MSKTYGGIDGCKGGWVFICGHPDKEIEPPMIKKNLSEILEKIESQSIRTAMDMAIGLNRCSVRKCDIEASKILGKRSSSVFQMPGNLAIERVVLPYFSNNDYSKFYEFNKKHYQLCGRGIKLSTFCIMNKIFEVNRECRDKIQQLQKKGLLFEFHPELFFNNEQQGILPKKSKQGLEQRCDIIQKCLKKCNVSACIDDWRKGKCSDIQRDDIIDAVAGMILASRDDYEELRFAQDVSDNGLEISIRY